MLTLLLVCAFSPRKYKSILRGFYSKVPFREIATASPLVMPRNDRVLRTEWNNGQCLAMTNSVLYGTMGRETAKRDVQNGAS